MSRLWSLLISMMLFLTLGAAQLPQACQGDGQGNACRADACICVASCTCYLDHARATLGADACCSVQVEAACHGPETPRHLALPEKHWFAAAPDMAAFAIRVFPVSEAHTPWAAQGVGHPDLLLPEKPPRPLV